MVVSFEGRTVASVQCTDNWAETLRFPLAKALGVPLPRVNDIVREKPGARAFLPSNLIQAQRDFFGAHTYERVDVPGVFHTDWIE